MSFTDRLLVFGDEDKLINIYIKGSFSNET